MSAGLISAPAAPVTALAEAKDWLRLSTGEDDAVLAALLRVAEESCEAFTGLALIEREMTEVIAASQSWVTLSAKPVSAIQSVAGLHADGEAFALPVDAFAIDIDARGRGLVKASGADRVQVTYRAGLAADWNGVPEPLRMGIVRLATELYRERDRDDARPLPTMIIALWQPWRRMGLG